MICDRRLLVVGVACLLVSAALFTGASFGAEPASPYDDKLSAPVENIKTFGGYDVPDYASTYGTHADPAFYLSLANTSTSMDSALAWANESSRREVLMQDNASKLLLVRAPPAAVLGGVMTIDRDVGGYSVPWVTHTSGLKTRSYVETIALEQRHEIAPLQSLDTQASAFNAPVSSRLVPGAWNQQGVAYSDDVNTTTLADVRDATGVDAVSETGAGTRAAICDTGLNVDNTTSPALYDNRIVAAKEFVGPNSEGLENVSTTNFHGPWVAAAIAANATNDSHDGIAPDAELVIGKALDDDGSGSTEDIRECILWAEQQGSDLISLSLGSPVYSAPLADAIRTALDGNVTAVYIAAGNSRQRPVGRYINSPADVPRAGVLTVAATDTARPSNASSAYFSSVAPDGGRDLSNGVTVGQEIDLAAPGMQIQAPIHDSTGYRSNHTLSGTSMATPVAVGVGLLQLDANPSLENDTEAFTGYARNTSSPVEGAGETEVGHGLANATNAVSLSPTEPTQEEVRSDAAAARDAANEGYSGSKVLEQIAKLTAGV